VCDVAELLRENKLAPGALKNTIKSILDKFVPRVTDRDMHLVGSHPELDQRLHDLLVAEAQMAAVKDNKCLTLTSDGGSPAHDAQLVRRGYSAPAEGADQARVH